MNMIKKHILTIILMVTLFAFSGIGNAAAGGKSESNSPAIKELVICYLPNSMTEELAEYRNMIQDAMGKAIGIKVTEINVADYNAVVEAMRTKKADIANFGPVTYVQAVERAGAEALVIPAPFGNKVLSGYTTRIVAKADSPIRRLEDLRGKTFAYVDPSSTSGNYVPALEFLNAFPGTTSEDFYTNGRFFSSVMYSGNHQSGALAVIHGDIDAAPIASNILNREIAAGRIRESDIRVIHESQLIPGSPIAIRSDLPDDLKRKIKEFYLSFNDPDYFLKMHGLRPEENPSFVEAFDQEYDYVRDLMERVMP